MKTNIYFFIITRSFFLRMRIVSDKNCRENQNTHFVFSNCFSQIVPFMRLCGIKHRVSIKSFPDYKQLLQENYVKFKLFLPLLKLVSKILCHMFTVTFVTFGFWGQNFPKGGLGGVGRHTGHHGCRKFPPPPPLTSFYGDMLRTKCFRHQFQILQI